LAAFARIGEPPPIASAQRPAAGRPDLVETAVFVSRRSTPPGASLRLTDAVRNRGPVAAPRSTTGFYLSSAYQPGDLRLGRRSVRSLSPRATSRGSSAVTVPRSTAPGAYRVLACADDRRRVRESNEANNCRAAAGEVRVTGVDRSRPTFAGLEAATTCIPGPIERRSSPFRLRWDPATDNVTPSSEIVYDVYQATRPGGEDFSAATYTAPAGATSFTTPPLPSDRAYYFVVRARDRAGNRDLNRVERFGANLCE
jgi:hypothetical protein